MDTDGPASGAFTLTMWLLYIVGACTLFPRPPVALIYALLVGVAFASVFEYQDRSFESRS